MPRRRQKRTQNHYALLVNKKADNYSGSAVRRLTGAIRQRKEYYTVIEPDSAVDLLHTAEQAAGKRKPSSYLSQNVSKRGKITALIACGGDGTFNLVARAAMAADMPVGILPLGRINNIARSLLGSVKHEHVIKTILSGTYQKIDMGLAGTQNFFGSIGLGFIPELQALLEDKGRPRFALGWSQLGARAAAEVKPVEMIVKIDAFRFEIAPQMFNINLVAFSGGLHLAPGGLLNDGHAEVTFDRGDQMGEFGGFTRQVYKKKYLYGEGFRQYRGTLITCQPARGRVLYLDGELVEVPTNVLEIKIGTNQVKVFS